MKITHLAFRLGRLVQYVKVHVSKVFRLILQHIDCMSNNTLHIEIKGSNCLLTEAIILSILEYWSWSAYNLEMVINIQQ